MMETTVSPDEEQAFLELCAEAPTPMEYNNRVATWQEPFLAGLRRRKPGDDGNAGWYVAMDKEMSNG